MMHLVTEGLYLNATCIGVDDQCPHDVWMPLEVCVLRLSCLMSRYGSYPCAWLLRACDHVTLFIIYINSTKMLNLCISNVTYMFPWGWAQQSLIVDWILPVLPFPSFNHWAPQPSGLSPDSSGFHPISILSPLMESTVDRFEISRYLSRDPGLRSLAWFEHTSWRAYVPPLLSQFITCIPPPLLLSLSAVTFMGCVPSLLLLPLLLSGIHFLFKRYDATLFPSAV